VHVNEQTRPITPNRFLVVSPTEKTPPDRERAENDERFRLAVRKGTKRIRGRAIAGPV
jgi:hypothetical protein